MRPSSRSTSTATYSGLPHLPAIVPTLLRSSGLRRESRTLTRMPMSASSEVMMAPPGSGSCAQPRAAQRRSVGPLAHFEIYHTTGVDLGHGAGDVQQCLPFMLDEPVVLLGLADAHGDGRSVAVVAWGECIQTQGQPLGDLHVR